MCVSDGAEEEDFGVDMDFGGDVDFGRDLDFDGEVPGDESDSNSVSDPGDSTSGSDSGDVNSDLDSSDCRSEPKKIAIDCETTGLGTNRHALQWGYATDTSAGSVYYNPGVNSTAGALKIQQLTPRFLHDRLWRCLQRRRCFRDVSFSSPIRCTLKMTVWNRLDTRVE
jgi:hypothetical protein